MAKVTKSYRLDGELIGALKAEAERTGANESETVTRLLSEALGLVEGGASASERREQDARDAAAEQLRAVLEERARLLEDHVADLRKQIEEMGRQADTLREQLAVKDEQIATANELAGQAQKLQAGQMVTTAPRLEEKQEPKRGFWASLWS